MRRTIGWGVLAILLTLLVGVPGLAAATITVDAGGGGDYTTISAAIAAASDGDEIVVSPGTYNETLNVNVDNLTIRGTHRNNVIIDISGQAAVNGAGIYIANGVSGVTLQRFTLQGCDSSADARYGIKVGEANGCTLSKITVKDIYRSGFDFLGATNLTVMNVKSMSNGGHGMALTDCHNVTVTNLTTVNNGWQSVSVATWGRYTPPAGTSGIVFSGTLNLGEVFQLEQGQWHASGDPVLTPVPISFSTDIADGADVTVPAGTFAYAFTGDDDEAECQRVYFFETLAEAEAVATLAYPLSGHILDTGRYIQSIVDQTQFYVSPGCEIQAAVDAANAGDTVSIRPGTYVENVVLDKALTLDGEASPPWVVIDHASGAAVRLRSPGGIPLSGAGIYTLDSLSGDWGILMDENMNPAEELVIEDLTIAKCWLFFHTKEGIAILNGAQVDGLTIESCNLGQNLNGLGISGSGTETTVVNNLDIIDTWMAGNSNHGLLVYTNADVSDVAIEGSYFHDNTWGGIHIQGAVVTDWTITDSEFLNNDYAIALKETDAQRFSITSSFFEDSGTAGILLLGDYAGSPASHAVEDFTIVGSEFVNNGWEHVNLAAWGTNLELSNVQILANTFGPGSTGVAVGTGAEFAREAVIAWLNCFETGGWGVINNSGVDVDASLNWWGDADGPSGAGAGGGDSVSADVIYSPWLGVNPDGVAFVYGDSLTYGVQVTSPLVFVVDDTGPAPTGGWLNRAIDAANVIFPTFDTIEVRAGVYDSTHAITDGVAILNTGGTASGTVLNGPTTIETSNVLLGRFGQGFTVNGDITVGAGRDASTIHINWNDLYGVVINGGFGTLDATFNYWGEDGPDTVGSVAIFPLLPDNVDTIIGYMDEEGLSALEAIDYAQLLRSMSPYDAMAVLALMEAYGFSREEAAAIVVEHGGFWVDWALMWTDDYDEFLAFLLGYSVGGGGGGAYVGGGGSVPFGLMTFEVGEAITLTLDMVHPVTGHVIDDATVSYTISREKEDGSSEIVAFGVLAFDADLTYYTVDVDTSGFEPGVYDVFLGTEDGRSKHFQIEVIAAEE